MEASRFENNLKQLKEKYSKLPFDEKLDSTDANAHTQLDSAGTTDANSSTVVGTNGGNEVVGVGPNTGVQQFSGDDNTTTAIAEKVVAAADEKSQSSSIIDDFDLSSKNTVESLPATPSRSSVDKTTGDSSDGNNLQPSTRKEEREKSVGDSSLDTVSLQAQLQNQRMKLSQATENKTQAKKAIKAWLKEFEAREGHPPSAAEKQEARHLYVDNKKVR